MKVLKKAMGAVKSAFRKLKSKFDKQGAYTGSPSNGNETPEQDADDL